MQGLVLSINLEQYLEITDIVLYTTLIQAVSNGVMQYKLHKR